MRVMAFTTLELALVFFRVNALHHSSSAVRVLKQGMTPQAKVARTVYNEFFDFPGMTGTRSMTIFTLDFLMPGTEDRFGVFIVAFGTAIAALVFDRECFPLIDIGQSIKIVGKGITVYAEIIGDHEMSESQYQRDHPQGKP